MRKCDFFISKCLVASVCFFTASFAPAVYAAQSWTVVGWVENVGLENTDIQMKARIDTGAGLASINANIVKIKKNEKGERVVFRVIDKDGQSRVLERDIVKWVNIKKKGASGTTRRPVVYMDFCIAGEKIRERVNLADRSDYLYPLLIGRNVLRAGRFLIDPGHRYLNEPDCGKGKEEKIFNKPKIVS